MRLQALHLPYGMKLNRTIPPHCTNLMLIQTIGGRYQLLAAWAVGGLALPSLLKLPTATPVCRQTTQASGNQSVDYRQQTFIRHQAQVLYWESRSDSTTFSLLRGKSRILCRNSLRLWSEPGTNTRKTPGWRWCYFLLQDILKHYSLSISRRWFTAMLNHLLRRTQDGKLV